MKTLLALLLLTATIASAGTVWTDSSHTPIQRPTKTAITQWPSDADLNASGLFEVQCPDDLAQRFWDWDGNKFVSKSAQDIGAIEAAEAAAQAEAEAYASTQPTVLIPRISGTLSNVVGTTQVLFNEDTGLPVFLDETGSPKHSNAQKDAQWKKQEAAKSEAVDDAISAIEKENSQKKKWAAWAIYERSKMGVE